MSDLLIARSRAAAKAAREPRRLCLREPGFAVPTRGLSLFQKILFLRSPTNRRDQKTTALNCKHAVALNSQEGEDAGGIGSGVDVDAVGSNVGFGDRCMTMHDEFAEVLVA